ncbi:hypothetical protein RY831_30510 [Noviherbaspirillum sp. CPCC 100848]|uniref:Uncharacterized protein n=1 Tax=Noviherbaspirillum album TaxID=3080276 RepID=A0ABU6JJM0_9BURK|nr:hypothetical protein [Noviherbaspirillum sp. CPCC 100848]MEC4723475.1 hypothetical protein [Noviherbaspirillum sp. CPCC 100848]
MDGSNGANRQIGGMEDPTGASAQCRDAAGWTLNLMADKLVKLRVVNAISRETVQRTLKKTTSNRG